MEDLLKLQYYLSEDRVQPALEMSKRGGHLWIFLATPLLAKECRIYIHDLALRLGVPVKGAGLAEGIEVFPKYDAIGPGDFGNAIRGPLGIHRGANRRFWFYGADYTLEGQIEYLKNLRKVTEDELRKFIAGKEVPQPAFVSRPTRTFPATPRTEGLRPVFRILDHVGKVRKVGRDYVTRCPVLRRGWSRPERRQPSHPDRGSPLLPLLGRLQQGNDSRCAGLSHSITELRVKRSAGMKYRQSMGQIGLTLSRQELRVLKDRGIFVQPAVSLEHQHLAKRYVVRGLESGGGVGNLGRYVTFAQPDGHPIGYLHPVDAIGVNGLHAVVIAPALVRVEMLRKEGTYELLITQHRPSEAPEGKRPVLESKVLFRGVHGRLELDLSGKDKSQRGVVVPKFYSMAGEEVTVPKRFQEAVRAVTQAVNCIGCSHCHYATAPKDDVTSPITLPNKKHKFAADASGATDLRGATGWSSGGEG